MVGDRTEYVRQIYAEFGTGKVSADRPVQQGGAAQKCGIGDMRLTRIKKHLLERQAFCAIVQQRG